MRLEPRHLVAVVEVVDDLVAARRARPHVELAVDRLRGARDAPRLGQHLAGAQQRLGRHAAVEGALAADELLLDDDDLQAGVGQAPRAHLPGRPGTDDDDVEAALAHGAQSIPVRPALQGRGILRGCRRAARRASLSSSPPLVARPAARTRPPETAGTSANATASTNDDRAAAESRRRAARRPAAACAWSSVGDFDAPLYVTAPPGDKRRVFVVEQAGRIMVVRGGKHARAAVPRHPLEGHRRRRAGPARDGLRPATTRSPGCFYVYYTEQQRRPRASWSTAAPSDDRADPPARASCCAWTTPSPTTTAACMIFGPDRLLYVGTGDGGGGNDQHGTRGNAQNLGSPLGKILRIDPRPSGGRAVHDPGLEPVRRARRAPAARSTPTACATRGASRSTAPTAT